MSLPLDRAGAALVPLNGLAALAGQRARRDVRITAAGDLVWVTWPPGESAVWQSLQSAPQVTFFEERAGQWYVVGSSLPRFDVPPDGESLPLDAAIVPGPIAAIPPPRESLTPVRLRIVRGDAPRPATAMRARLTELRPWIETATSAALHACRVALQGDRVMLLGPGLPVLPQAERFWGERVLVPLGMRPDPDLPETALRGAADVALDELLVLTESGAEAVPESAFQPLNRAAFRIACGDR